MAVRERLDEDLVNWDLTRKRMVATALEAATQALLRTARTPTVTTTTETVSTVMTTTAAGTTTETTTTTVTVTAPNAGEVAVLANSIAALVSSVS